MRAFLAHCRGYRGAASLIVIVNDHISSAAFAEEQLMAGRPIPSSNSSPYRR
jgi:hypothetical protein